VRDAIGRVRPESDLGWLSGVLAGVYYAAIASSILLLAIHVVGFVYWFADNRINSWQTRLRASGAALESSPRFHTSRIRRVGIHLLCYLLATALILVYFLYATILWHRDTSELALPTERFPNRPRPKGIRIEVDPSNQAGDSSSV
jgi:hypothetical protein